MNKILTALTSLVFFLILAPIAFATDIVQNLGQITSVYQSTGDMMSIGTTNAVLRIPIGTTGQVLTVQSNGTPAWASGVILSSGTTAAAAYTLTVRADPQRTFNFDGSSDTALTLTFGDAGVTAAQNLVISGSTADADDDSSVAIAGGGAVGSARGGNIQAWGNESAGTGRIDYTAGNISGGTHIFSALGAQVLIIKTSGIEFQASGSTIAIQEATAGAACSGTFTANGTTPVAVTTTCAQTGMRTFFTKTATSAVNGSCYRSALSNGTSFTVTCLATDTGAYDWFIVHESP
jgi:hypothetical protein